MKILVCVSKVPDTTTKISFIEGDTKFNEEKVQFIVNPYDEWYALVRALELKETIGGTVTIITVGDATVDAIIRKALSLGADDAVRIDAQPKESYFTAMQIANYAKANNYDLILTGKETIDYNGSEVGGMIAEFLNAPYISHASKLEIQDQKAILDIDITGGVETVSVNLPCVVSAAKGMAEQRIPNMRGIMAAKSKPIIVVVAQETTSLTEVVKYEMPPSKSECKMIDPEDMDQLVALLHSEAKVI